MSDALKEYITKILVASILTAVVKAIGSKSSMVNAILNTLCAVFLSIVILSPLIHFDFTAITNHVDVFSAYADKSVESGSELTKSALSTSIKEQAEAYILDKAASLNADLTVEVTLSDDEIPAPYSVVLAGRVSPYAKSFLVKLIADDLGILKENQIWQ